ncbi:hypothetical protein V6N13_125620 [Hibiscus sabdariffa]
MPLTQPTMIPLLFFTVTCNFIYPHVLKSAPEVLESIGTKLVHTQILKSGFGHYHVVQTTLVDSYSRTGSCIEIARDLFDEMSERNLVSWTAMVSGYMRAKPCVGPCHYPAYKSGSTNKYQRLRRKLRPDPRFSRRTKDLVLERSRRRHCDRV